MNKYTEEAWETIMKEIVKYGGCISAGVRSLRRNYPGCYYLSRQTVNSYLNTEAGAKMYQYYLQAYKERVQDIMDKLNENDSAHMASMTLYELWETCTKNELKLAMLGDKESGRLAIQLLRVGPLVPRYDEEEDEEWEKKAAAAAAAGGADNLLSARRQPQEAAPNGASLSRGGETAPPFFTRRF